MNRTDITVRMREVGIPDIQRQRTMGTIDRLAREIFDAGVQAGRDIPKPHPEAENETFLRAYEGKNVRNRQLKANKPKNGRTN